MAPFQSSLQPAGKVRSGRLQCEDDLVWHYVLDSREAQVKNIVSGRTGCILAQSIGGMRQARVDFWICDGTNSV